MAANSTDSLVFKVGCPRQDTLRCQACGKWVKISCEKGKHRAQEVKPPVVWLVKRGEARL